MLMEDGFSYTKSELQAGDQSSVRGGSSSSTGSESDELTASLVEKNANQARKGARVIENRMNYFKKHLKLLRMEGGKIIDPFRHHLFQTLGAEAKNIKMDWKEAGLARHSFSTPKQQSMLLTDRRESGLLRHKSPVKMTGRSVSTAEFHFALDQLVHSKGSEELERKLAQYEVIRTKRLLTIEKLYEYMEMLENKQQQRLIEEHRTSFRSFKYAGPSREGALFCLREKYRRERKAMRVKYAKKYGLLCRQVRLEKRLMRKAKRLLTRERILNLLKEKSRSKLILLMEMKYEFKKLVEKLKLNKELQEKIRRQDRLSNKAGEKKDPKAQKETETRKSMFTGARQNTNLETAEVQKSPITRGKSRSISSLSVMKLPPLPCPPSTSTAASSEKLPPIKPLSKDRIMLKAPRASRTDLRCPPLVHDKKLGAGKSQTGSSSLSDKVSIYKSPSQNLTSKVSKARMAKSTHRELPLINEVKYGALPSEEIRKGISTTTDESVKKIDDCSDPRLHGNTEKDSIQYLLKKEQRIESNLQRGKREADELSRVKGVRHLPSEKESLSRDQNQVTEEKAVKQRISKTHQQKSNTKLAPYFDVTKFPNRRLLPGGLVRRSDIDRIPRYKYKSEDTQNVLDFFQSIYQKFVEDDLKVTFGSSRSESFVNSIIKDIKGMADFIFGHLHLFSLEEAAMVEKALKDFADTRLDSFMKMAQGYRLLINDSAFFGEKRHAIKLKKDMAVAELEKGYKGYVLDTMQRRIDYRADKTLKGRTNKVTDESNVISKKKKRKSLADKLLLRRGHQFNNPVRVTTKLGGKLMLQGWKTLSFEEYVTIGGKIDVEKSGWRKDGMEHYEVIIPREPVDDLKYLLILNRLDLTPRRFSYPGYKFNSHIVYMYKYCSSFYRSCLLKRGERKTDKRRASFQDSYTKARFLFTGGLLQGEFRVPHLRHRIFSTPPNALHTAKPKDRNTPLVFSMRDEIVDEDDEPKKLRIQLQETETLNLWSYESTVAYRGTEEAQIYTKFARRMNKYSSRFHRCFEAETQTELVNNIDRSTQIYAPCTDTKSTNVYETDIMKASEDLPPPVVKSIKRPGFQEDDVSDPSTVCSVSSVESFPDENRKIMTSSEFLSKIRLTLRIMDSMIYSENQMTFRRGLDMDPLDPKAEISYSHERLFSFIDKRIALSEYVVTTMDWSSLNPNLLAVGYSRHPLYPEQDKGMICIWNIKMITKYERKFEFKNGVTYLQFCVPHPRLLNVALLDGSVLILDLGAKRNLVVTTKLSCVFSDYKPVWQFSWIELEKDHFIPITCGDNGFIHQLRPDGTFQHSKFLSLGHREGKVKGIKMSSSMGLKPRLRGRPGITCLVKHPTDPVLYLVGTTDGCVHICSIYFRNQHLDVFSAHIGAVKGIQFHPHCEHVFLTYGEDFYVRVWLYGTFEPALELMAGNFYVRAARWSPINPEILVSISNKHVDVWDIRRKTDTPIHRFMNPRKIENTALIFDKSGRNIVLGNIGGDVYVYALKNMPFTHYFNGEAIASALEKVLKAKKKFVRDIRKLGYPFGAKKEQPL